MSHRGYQHHHHAPSIGTALLNMTFSFLSDTAAMQSSYYYCT